MIRPSRKAGPGGLQPYRGARRKPKVLARAGPFAVKPLTPDDSSETYLAWINDADLMNPLNMPARKLTLRDLRTHIAQHSEPTRQLLGIFHEAGAGLIGVALMNIDMPNRSARFSLFIGDKRYRGHIGLVVLGRRTITHLFEQRGIEKIRAQIATDNLAAIAAAKAWGLSREGRLRGEIRAFDSARRIDQYVFGLLKSDWRVLTRINGFNSIRQQERDQSEN